ncbi:MAG: hypothetical protein A2Z14_04170 [Chloroflexi bacterium RBG_16_48_8]|nr:MAG: hypothetical protein A2Z14_04170 [Chloroflexi bacterium RBG_16_48_8]
MLRMDVSSYYVGRSYDDWHDTLLRKVMENFIHLGFHLDLFQAGWLMVRIGVESHIRSTIKI